MKYYLEIIREGLSMNYPKDKLYLRVSVLLKELMEAAQGDNFNISDTWLYLRTIELKINRWILSESASYDSIVEIERELISPDFLSQRTFNKDVISKLKPIIREYKLRMML